MCSFLFLIFFFLIVWGFIRFPGSTPSCIFFCSYKFLETLVAACVFLKDWVWWLHASKAWRPGLERTVVSAGQHNILGVVLNIERLFRVIHHIS